MRHCELLLESDPLKIGKDQTEIEEGRYRSLFLRFVRMMEGPLVPANAVGVIAAEAAELAAELVVVTGAVNIFHVSLHVRLVCALVGAVGTGVRGVTRIHFATELYVPL